MPEPMPRYETPEPFTIRVPDHRLDDLDERLRRWKPPTIIDNAAWDYGTDPAFLRDLVDHWRYVYDWRRLEDEINGYVDRGTAGTTVSMPARVAGRITEAIGRSLGQLTAGGHPPVVVASPQVRGVVRQLLEPHAPNAAVLGYNEIVSGVEVESVALVTSARETQEARTAA